MTVSDNGAWTEATDPEQRGMGLRIIKYRTELIRGELTIDRGTPGTVVLITFRNPPPTGS